MNDPTRAAEAAVVFARTAVNNAEAAMLRISRQLHLLLSTMCLTILIRLLIPNNVVLFFEWYDLRQWRS
ncbi:hypothetical protein ACOSQ3_013557 [Xanthoceras sorbifolium]